jgi:leucyl aminopeptidase
MEYFTTSGDAAKRATECAIVGLYSNGSLGRGAAEIDEATGGFLGKLKERGDISGKLGRAHLITNVDGVRCKRILVTGLGKKSGFGVRQYRKALDAAFEALTGTAVTEAISYLHREPVAGSDAYYLARYAAQTLGDRLYRFTRLKTSSSGAALKLKKLGFGLESRSDGDAALSGARHAQAIVRGMDLARELGNLPANVCTPSFLAEEAEKLAKHYRSMEIEILEEDDMRELGMGALLSVTAGADEPAKLIVLKYTGGAEEEAPVILVGKGITFDTGGISLKPAPSMDEMKFDMCGAAAVIGTMQSVAAMKLPINLTVIVPTCENMPSGRATRPGDIVKSMSGKTIEILNTDAEGRLILCDALTYAQRYEPQALIDVATLTGACIIALGNHNSGLMSNDDDLANGLLAAGRRADDTAWRLPLGEDYEKQLKSNFADFANVGGREGGAITAGCFLSKFTRDAVWAHLDIAGTGWRSGARKGASGRPVPLLVDYLIERASAKD